MASLPESSTFDAGVYQLETTDPVIGGPSGVSNTPLRNLANRTKYLKDHVDALETSRAPIASPAFTGTPTAPTPAANTNTTQIATTAYVQNELADYAPLASPALTGSPTAPTPGNTENSTRVATTAWVRGALATIAAAAGFASSFGTSGYIKLPSWLGGFIIQWGFNSIPTGNGDSVVFPITFPNAVQQVMAVDGGAGTHTVSTVDITITGFKAYGRSVMLSPIQLAPTAFRWLAIGY